MPDSSCPESYSNPSGMRPQNTCPASQRNPSAAVPEEMPLMGFAALNPSYDLQDRLLEIDRLAERIVASSSEHRPELMTITIGDHVRVIGLPSGLPDATVRDDLTLKALFERCVGRVLPVTGIAHGMAELEVGEVIG